MKKRINKSKYISLKTSCDPTFLLLELYVKVTILDANKDLDTWDFQSSLFYKSMVMDLL